MLTPKRFCHLGEPDNWSYIVVIGFVSLEYDDHRVADCVFIFDAGWYEECWNIAFVQVIRIDSELCAFFVDRKKLCTYLAADLCETEECPVSQWQVTVQVEVAVAIAVASVAAFSVALSSAVAVAFFGAIDIVVESGTFRPESSF